MIGTRCSLRSSYALDRRVSSREFDFMLSKHDSGACLFYGLGVFSMVYMDSGRLLPLNVIGAGTDFIHIFRTV